MPAKIAITDTSDMPAADAGGMTVEHILAAIAAGSIEGHDDPRSQATRLALAMSAAMKTHETERPMAAWFLSCLPALPADFEMVALTSPFIDEAHDLFCPDDEAEMLVFVCSDGSALWSDLDDRISTEEFVLRDDAIDPAKPFALDMAVAIHGASPGFIARHGSLEVFLETLPEELDECSLSTMAEEIADLADPPIDNVDMNPQHSWSDEQSAALEDLFGLVYLGLELPMPLEVKLNSAVSAFDGDEDEEEARIECSIDDEEIRPISRRFTEILGALTDLSMFQGHAWEYNDGVRDRISGYSRYPVDVICCELDPKQFSAHDRMSARWRLGTALAAAGKSQDEIDDLLDAQTLIPVEI